MARMVRKQICIDASLDARVEELAAKRGVSQSEIVRDALEALFSLSARAEERTGWEDFLAFAETRHAGGAPAGAPSGRTWRRDDLYEDRG
jgi:hypothetical protein